MIKICTHYYSEYNEVKKILPALVKAGIPFDFQAAQGPYVAQFRNANINIWCNLDLPVYHRNRKADYTV